MKRLLRYTLFGSNDAILVKDVGVEEWGDGSYRIRYADLRPVSLAIGGDDVDPRLEMTWSYFRVRNTKGDYLAALREASWESNEGCPQCGHRGEFIRLALCCPVHGCWAGA